MLILRDKRQWNLNKNTTISSQKNNLKVSPAKLGPFCLGLKTCPHQ